MNRKLEEIAAEALQLTVEARAALAKRLLESLDDISPEENERLWVEEAARRYRQLKDGRAKSIPSEKVFSKLSTTSAAMKSRFHDDDDAELIEAVEYYDATAEGLGDRLFVEVNEAVGHIEHFPDFSGRKVSV